jgi:hypothetical protein
MKADLQGARMLKALKILEALVLVLKLLVIISKLFKTNL